jgi:membrane protein YqaA with SNARE-associated domain
MTRVSYYKSLYIQKGCFLMNYCEVVYWVLSWAESPYGAAALFLLAFAESSFFPIPPDVLLIALCVGNRLKSFWFAFLCTIGSILGGIFGYIIGFSVWIVVQDFFFNYVPGFTQGFRTCY